MTEICDSTYSLTLALFLAVFSSCSGLVPTGPTNGAGSTNSEVGSSVSKPSTLAISKLSQTRLPFIKNNGQYDGEVKFAAKTFAGTVYLTDDELVYDLPKLTSHSSSDADLKARRGVAIREQFLRANKAELSPTAATPSGTVHSSFLGRDKSKWISGAETYETVHFGEPWKGISVEVRAYGNNIEKVFTVQPGINPESIALGIDGAESLSVDRESGELKIQTALGLVSFSKPIAFQEIDGGRREVQVAYVARGNEYGFELGKYDSSRPLIIDPVVASTFVGSSSNDYIYAMAIDGSSNVYVAGFTYSSGFPTTTGAYDEGHNGGADVLVSKFNSTLTTLSASTFIGGSGDDIAQGIALDSSGNVFIVGQAPAGYPTTSGAYDESHDSSVLSTLNDIVVSKLNSSLTTLSASTYIGGSAGDSGKGIVIDGSDNVYIVGAASNGATPYPTTGGAYDTTNSNGEVVVSKFNSGLTSLLASTFVGGTGSDDGYSIKLDRSGNVFITGITSSGFPATTGAYDETANGSTDGFVAKLSGDLTSLSAATYLGGSGLDVVHSLAFDSSGNVYVAGQAAPSGFPTTTGAYDETHNGNADGFISKLTSDLTTLSVSTFVGTSSDDIFYRIALDGSNNVYVVGYGNAGYPTTSGTADTSHNGGQDIVVTKLNSTLTTISASTYLGGGGGDNGRGLVLHGGNVYVSGNAQSGYPTTSGAYDTSANGNDDAVITILDSVLSGDTTAPTVTNVTSSTSNGTYKAGDSISIQVAFDETVVVTGTPQLTLETGTTDAVVNYASGSGSSTLTFTYTVSSGHTSNDLDYLSTSALALNSGTIRDASDNNAILTLASPGASGSLGNNKAIVIDTTAPTLTISSTTSSPTNTTPIPVTFTFSESVTGFTVGEITVGNGSAGSVSGSGTTYTASITPSGQGAVTVDVAGGVAQDIAGNDNSAATQLSRTYDSVTQTPTFSSPTSGTRSNSFTIGYTLPETSLSNSTTLTFINASSTTVATLTLTNVAAATPTSFSLDPTNLTASANVQSSTAASVADGTYTLRISYQDALGNPAVTASTSSVTVDTTGPSVTITSGLSGPTSTSPIPVTVVFSESVTGFSAGDLTVGNGSAGAVAGSGTTYSANITPSGNGTVAVGIAAGAANDSAGNGNQAGGQFSILYTTAPPTIDLQTDPYPLPITSLSGTGIAGTDVELFDSSTSLGTTTIDGSGSWTTTLSSTLLSGTHELSARGANGIESTPVLVEVLPSALDADGDGVSDIGLFKKGSCYIADGVSGAYTTAASYLGGSTSVAASADYDGDGEAECAAASVEEKKIRWWFYDSGSSITTTEIFGQSSDYVMTGCSFDATRESEMAVMRGTQVIFKHRGNASETSFTVPAKFKGKLRGCGDLNGDGVDELLFRTIAGKDPKKAKYGLVAVNTSGVEVETLNNVGAYYRAYVTDAYGSSARDLIFNVGSKSKRSLNIRERSGTANASSVTGLRGSFAIGVCKNSNNDFVNCLHYDASGSIARRLLKSGAVSSTSTSTAGMNIVDGVNIYAPGLVALP